MTVSSDPFNALGIPKTASMAEAKQAYNELAKELHPDLHADKSPQEREDLQEKFKMVKNARDQLRQFRDEELYATQQRLWTRVKTSWTAAKSGRGHSGNTSNTKEEPSAAQSQNPSEGA